MSELLRFAATAPIDITAKAEGKRPTFSGVVYAGGPLKIAGWRDPIIVDLQGLTATEPLSVLADHDPAKLLGQTDTVRIDGTGVFVGGRITGDDGPAAQVLKHARNGFVWPMSIGAEADEIERVIKGTKVTVNGKLFVGPLFVARQSRLREVSFVSIGADAKARAAVQGQSDIDIGDTTMKDTDEQAILTAERERCARIEAACEGIADTGNLKARALKDGWTVEQLESKLLAQMKQDRKDAGATAMDFSRPWVGDSRAEANTTILAAAALLAAGQREAAESVFDERTLTAAADLGLDNSVDLAGEAVRLATGRRPRGTAATIEAAFSTSELGSAMAEAGRGMLHAGYMSAPANWKLISKIMPVKTFHEHKSIRPFAADSLLSQVGEAGELKHTALSEEDWPCKAETFGRVVGLTRKTIINDELSSIFEIQRDIGLAAGRTLNRSVWLLIREAGAGHFHSDFGNLLDGATSALGLAGLGLAVAALREQVDGGGEPIDLQPGVLAVPPSLEAAARSLINSTETLASGGQDIERLPADNPWRNLATVAIVPHLSAAAGGVDATWYLAAKPTACPAVLVALLDGKEGPTVEQVPPPAELLGLQFRCYFDFGVSLADKKAIVKADGS